MPICLANSPQRISRRFPVLAKCLHTQGCRQSRRRYSSRSDESKPTPLTLLHKTAALLPRILPPPERARTETESLVFWDKLLAGLHDTRRTNARIAVYGLDEWSGARDLVAALLEDPFTSDESARTTLRERWNNTDASTGTLTIEPTSSVENTSDDVLRIPSPWLQRFPLPLQIAELSTAAPLFSADISIIVCNPLNMTPADVLASRHLPLSNPNSTIVFTVHPPPPDLAAALRALNPSCTILFINPAQALGALHALERGEVQRYQDDFNASHLSELTKTVSPLLSLSPRDFYASTTAAHVLSALGTARVVLDDAEAEVREVYARVDVLKGEVEEARARVRKEVLGVDGEQVKRAITEAEKGMRSVLNVMSLWNVMRSVDDISALVDAAAQKVWCKELERQVSSQILPSVSHINIDSQLLIHTGRLSALRDTLNSTTISQTIPSPSSPLHSPLLLNALQQLAVPALPSTSLTAPLHARLAQLHAPTARLHIAAQRTVAGAWGSGIASALAASYGYGWMELGAEVSLAGGALLALGGANWAASAWARAQRRWWADWGRVGEGLGRDLEDALDTTVRERVTLVAAHAIGDLEGRLDARREEIGALRDEVGVLEADARKVLRVDAKA
ncbi:hypothetical protein PLICRDRAFT_172838 [Plicaturopsis crispa FD-325 SS-3]|nr:hypothetical protein PLICRDRAFT_172838 [Plicaturopsis crispa FD-325 SS-3]